MTAEVVVDDVLQEFPNAKSLSRGGQKVVFTYDHPQFGQVVLKVGNYSAASLERIRREVEALRKIESDCFPRNIDFRILTGNRFLIVEERMDGDTLANHLTEFASVPGASRLIESIVKCLRILWDDQIVHRDLKPQNIIITPQGNPKIIDLGIARILNMSTITNPFFARGPGTPNYAAPEQLLNRKTAIDHRTDQFVLGIVYGQLLLGGRHPFDPQVVGRGEAIDKNIVSGHWAKTEFEGDEFERVRPIINKMLGHEPYLRYRDPNDLQSDLGSILRGHGDG